MSSTALARPYCWRARTVRPEGGHRPRRRFAKTSWTNRAQDSLVVHRLRITHDGDAAQNPGADPCGCAGDDSGSTEFDRCRAEPLAGISAAPEGG
jgi:hypothetical protein